MPQYAEKCSKQLKISEDEVNAKQLETKTERKDEQTLELEDAGKEHVIDQRSEEVEASQADARHKLLDGLVPQTLIEQFILRDRKLNSLSISNEIQRLTRTIPNFVLWALAYYYTFEVFNEARHRAICLIGHLLFIT